MIRQLLFPAILVLAAPLVAQDDIDFEAFDQANKLGRAIRSESLTGPSKLDAMVEPESNEVISALAHRMYPADDREWYAKQWDQTLAGIQKKLDELRPRDREYIHDQFLRDVHVYHEDDSAPLSGDQWKRLKVRDRGDVVTLFRWRNYLLRNDPVYIPEMDREELKVGRIGVVRIALRVEKIIDPTSCVVRYHREDFSGKPILLTGKQTDKLESGEGLRLDGEIVRIEPFSFEGEEGYRFVLLDDKDDPFPQRDETNRPNLKAPKINETPAQGDRS